MKPSESTDKPKVINADIEITVTETDEDNKPQKRITIDNGLLPWGTLFFISTVVMFLLFVYLCAVEWSETVAQIFVGSIYVWVILLIPYSFRFAKTWLQDGRDHHSTIEEYYGK